MQFFYKLLSLLLIIVVSNNSLLATCGLSVESTIVENAACGQNNGNLKLTVSGGTSPLTYLWSTGSTNQNLANLTAGVYTATITDATGCTLTQSVAVHNQNSAVISNISSNSATCLQTNGSINFDLTSSGAFDVAWSGPLAGTQTGVNSPITIPNLSKGTYVVEVLDANGCLTYEEITIADANVLNTNLNVLNAPTCAGGNNGSINLQVPIGAAPYEFFLDGVSQGAIALNNFTYSNLTGGTYYVEVVDGNGCSSGVILAILDEAGSTALNIADFSTSTITCPAGENGSISNSGSCPTCEVYSKTTGALMGNLAAPITNLRADQYYIQFSSGGCRSFLGFTINDPEAFEVNANVLTDCQTATMQLDLFVAGATGPNYTYNWSSGATTQNLTAVPKDNYIVTITDAASCIVETPSFSFLPCTSEQLLDIYNGTSITVCADTNDVPGTVATVLNSCFGAVNNGTLVSMNNDGCITYVAGNIMGLDTVCVEVCDGNGVCDTTSFIFNIQSSTITSLTQVDTSITTTICIDSTALPGTVVSLLNLGCSPILGTINATGTGSCFSYTSPTTYTNDTICWEFCDNQGFCDTAISIIATRSPTDTIVQVVETTNSVTYCVDISSVSGAVVSVFNICPGAANNGSVAPILLDGCVTYTAGTFIGSDTVCVQVCDGGGICDTTILIFEIESSIDSSSQLLNLGQTTSVCVDTTALPGNIISFTNLNCATIDGTINSIGNACFTYTAPNTIGNDTICWAFCDDQGFCDTAVVVLVAQSPRDTIFVSTPTNTTKSSCLDLSVFTGTVQSINNLNCSPINQLTINNINSTTGCIEYTTGGVAGTDTICLEVCDNQGFCDTTILVVNIYPQPDTIFIQVTAGGAVVDTCTFGSQLPGAITSYTDLACAQDTLGTLSFDNTTGCISYTPPSTSTGTATDTVCIQFCDSGVPNAYCDTAVFIIQIIPTVCVFDPLPNEYNRQVSDCNNIELCVDVPFNDLNDYNVLLNGNTYTGATSACKLIREISYDGASAVSCAGNLSIQWVLNGITFGPQAVSGINGIVAQLNVWDGSTAWALSGTSIVLGNNNGNDQVVYGGLTISCTGQNPVMLQPTIVQQRAKGTNLSFNAVGTYSLVVEEKSTNCKDTSDIGLYCIQSSIIRDTVVMGASKQKCTIDIGQVPNVSSIVNNCAGAGTGNASFVINGNCVTFTGNSTGSDLACILVCSNTGICDTTYVFIEVIPPVPSPKAVDDTIVLQEEQIDILLDVCANDSTYTSTFSVTLLTTPNSGAISQNDCQITYTPDRDFCGQDSFEYSLDNGAGLSTAMVRIERQCIDSVTVYDGFSPNGDGFNDFFVVKGLTQYPDHEIVVFNRWGNRVLKAVKYQNDWDGKFNGGDLPDGYYFYFINLNDGNGAILSGCLILRR